MFHMKHCATAKQHRAAAKCLHVSCETFPHPYILCRAGKLPQAACKTRGTYGACRRSSALPSCGNACRRRRHRCFLPPRNATAAARQFRHSRNCLSAHSPQSDKRERQIMPAARTISHHRISLYNNEENCVNFARKPREKPLLPTDFSRGFSAVKHARETSKKRADFPAGGRGIFCRLCRKLPPKTAFLARRRKKIFARKKVCFRTAYI